MSHPPKLRPRNLDVALATSIIREAVRPDCSVQRIAELARASPGFALRLLSLVNSAGLGGVRRITDVQRACAMLGVRRLRNLSLGLVVSNLAPAGERGRVVLASSVRRAAAAQSLAVAMKLPEPGSHFMTGLFLEIGLVALVSERPTVADEVLSGPARMRPVHERSLGQAPHPEVGAALASDFGLPSATVEAIRSHHDARPPEEMSAKVAWVAEQLAAVFEGGDPAQLLEAAERAGRELGLDESQIGAILGGLPAEVEAAALSFHRDLGEQVGLDALMADANRALVEMNESYETLVRRLEAVIAQKDEMARELARLARVDELTGLPNKRSLNAAMARDLAHLGRVGGDLSLIVIDVDHFKKFNDTWGHVVGDEVLRAVGEVLSSSVRGGDMAARFGGEEFVVLLRNADAQRARAAAERLRILLARKSIEGPHGPLSVTASFGVATLSGRVTDVTPVAFLQQADAALYEAKRSGRNRVACAAWSSGRVVRAASR